MSGMRMRQPARSRTQLLPQAKPIPLKKKRRPVHRPPWDSTTKDLSVMKLSNQELQRKHEIHQPKKDHERLLRQMLDAKLMMSGGDEGYSFNTTTGYDTTQNEEIDIQRAVLDDYERLYRGAPHVTKAPDGVSSKNGFIHDLSVLDQSYYDTLSKSVVSHPELNYHSEEEETEDRGSEKLNCFQANMDLTKYQKILDESYSLLQDERKEEKKRQNVLKESKKQNIGVNKENHHDDHQRTLKDHPQQIKPIRSCLKTDKENFGISNNSTNTTTSTSSFTDMNQMLRALEEDLHEYEVECGRTHLSETQTMSISCQGYTASLLSITGRLIKHLKESERQLREEMSMRREIMMAFEEQKCMIDALTNDLIETQDENERLKEEIFDIKEQSQSEYTSLRQELQRLEEMIESR
ncbi:spindle and centriole-associated protein 1-like isoform X1 [Clytia hemisphaerica]